MIPSWVLQVLGERKWCVAGGYAACPALASDIDLWVYGIAPDLLQWERDNIAGLLKLEVDELNRNRPKWAEKRYGFVREEGQETTEIYDQIENLIEKVGVVSSPRVALTPDPVLNPTSVKCKPIHIMVTTAPDPGSLISGFDISTHAVAIDYTGRVWTHVLYTGPHEQPAILRIGTNTQQRFDRICDRFGHESFTIREDHVRHVGDVPF